jgi:hypothetical protein
MPADLHRLRERRVAVRIDGNLQFLHFFRLLSKQKVRI